MPRTKTTERQVRKSRKNEDRSVSTESSDDHSYPRTSKMDFEEVSENSEGWSDDDGLTSEEDLPIRPKRRGLADSEGDLMGDLAAASKGPKISSSTPTRPTNSIFYPKSSNGQKAAPLGESPLVKRLNNLRSSSAELNTFDLEDEDDDEDDDASPLGTAPYMAKRENSAGRNLGQMGASASNRPPSPPMNDAPQARMNAQSLSPKLPVRSPEIQQPVSEAATDPNSYIGYRTSNTKKGIVPRNYVHDPNRIDPNENPDAYYAAEKARNEVLEAAAAIAAGTSAAQKAPIDAEPEQAPIPKNYYAPRSASYSTPPPPPPPPEAPRSSLPSIPVYQDGSASNHSLDERDPESSIPSVTKIEDHGGTEYSDDRRASDTISYYSYRKEDGTPTFWALVACLACALILLAAVLGGVLSTILLKEEESAPVVVVANTTSAPTPAIVEEIVSPAPTTLAPSMSPVATPSMVPTTSGFRPKNKELYDKIVAALPAGNETLIEEGTPQNQAYLWLEADAELQELSDVKLIQRFALATFYYSTNGDEWLNNGSWLDALDECLWYTDSSTAFNCDGDIFTTLEFNKNNIGGTLPPELAMLTSLKTFNIINEPTGESVKVQGSLPTELGLLTSMEFFSFKNHNLTGTIAPELFLNWPVVDTVLMERCKLSGQIPTTIGLLTSATKISFRKNDLTGPIPTQVGDTPKMLQFSVDGNLLTGTIPTEFGKLAEAKGIWVNDNKLVGTIPNEFGNLKMIKAGLRFSNNQLTGTIPSSLGTLVDMKNFNAENNLLTGPVPDFSALVNVKELRIEGNSLVGEINNATCAIIVAQQALASADCPSEVACACCENCPV